MSLLVLETYKGYDTLCATVQSCLKCVRMEGSTRVLNRGAGKIDAPIMFIGEAPGRLGADNSGIPFHGDKAGHNFEELLEFAGLTRANIFVTNAVLCNPKDEKGNNASPNQLEIANCSSYLKQQIDLINPKIVVALGANALKALSLVYPHNFTLSDSVRTANSWYGRKLIPLYHPGQRAMIHRSFANQRSDYQFVAEQLRRLGAGTKVIHGKTKADVAAVVDVIVSSHQELSYFALHKLFYLVELAHIKLYGERLTKAFFIRQKDGPYCVDLHPQKLRKILPYLEFQDKRGLLLLSSARQNLLPISEKVGDALPKEVRDNILRILSGYCGLEDSKLKTKVYLTSPMRKILREEKNSGVNLYNSPIDLHAS